MCSNFEKCFIYVKWYIQRRRTDFEGGGGGANLKKSQKVYSLNALTSC